MAYYLVLDTSTRVPENSIVIPRLGYIVDSITVPPGNVEIVSMLAQVGPASSETEASDQGLSRGAVAAVSVAFGALAAKMTS